MEIADAKNFSISVDKDELAMIGETGAKYKYLSQEIADHNSVIYSYSNVYNEFSTKPKSNIDIKKVVSLNSFFNEDRVLQNDNVDFAGKIIWEDIKDAHNNVLTNPDGTPRRVEVFSFGKYRGTPVAEVLDKDPGYYSWMLASDFTLNTKQVLTRIRHNEFNKRRSF